MGVRGAPIALRGRGGLVLKAVLEVLVRPKGGKLGRGPQEWETPNEREKGDPKLGEFGEGDPKGGYFGGVPP